MGNNCNKKENSNELTIGEVEIIKSLTKLKDIEIKQWYEEFKNESPYGLSPIAFRKIYQKCFPERFAMNFCDHIFRTMDTDKSGYINLQEFLLIIALTSNGKSEEKLSWVFR